MSEEYERPSIIKSKIIITSKTRNDLHYKEYDSMTGLNQSQASAVQIAHWLEPFITEQQPARLTILW